MKEVKSTDNPPTATTTMSDTGTAKAQGG